MKSLFLSVLLVLLATVLLQGGDSAQAQSIFLEPNNIPAVHLEALRPGLGGMDFSESTFALFLSSRITLGERLQLRAEVPYMTFQVEKINCCGNVYSSSTGTENAFGNPYVGVDGGDLERGFQMEFGFRVPVVKDNKTAAQSGILTDPVERMEAFVRDIVPVYMGVNFRHRSQNGFAMRLRLVPVFWIDVGSGSNKDTDIFLLYSAQAWYESGKVGVGGGFSGRFIATGEAEGFGERSLHQFGFFANYAFGSFLPGFQVRFPLDEDLKDSYVPAYSISIGVKL